MNITNQDKVLYEKIIDFFPYKSIIYVFRNHSLGEGFHESTVKPLNDFIFEYENNPTFRFNNLSLDHLLGKLYKNSVEVITFLSLKTMLGEKPHEHLYWLVRPWDGGEYSEEREERFQKDLEEFNCKVSVDFVEAYDNLVKEYTKIILNDSNEVAYKRIEDIKDPTVFIALYRIATKLIKDIWNTSLLSNQEIEAEFNLVKARSKKYEKDIKLLANIDTELNWGEKKHKSGEKSYIINKDGDFNPWYSGELELDQLLESLKELVEFLQTGDEYIQESEFLHYYEWLYNLTRKKDKAKFKKESGTQNMVYYIAPQRIQELKSIRNNNFDLKKLIRYCEELNNTYANENYLSTIMLVRSIMNHIPPIFDKENFERVSNNYG